MLAGNVRDAEAAFAHALTAAEAEDSHLQIEAHIRLGDVQRLAGAVGSARAAYETARAIAEQRLARDPANSVWQRHLTISDDRISELRRAQGDGPETLGAYRRSLAEREALVARDPANTEWQRNLAVSHDRIAGVLLAQGDAPGALAAYRRSLAVREALDARSR
jgi:tetratricopeptide (TPR) repeat protein